MRARLLQRWRVHGRLTRARLLQLWRASIYGPESVDASDQRLAGMLRVWMPLYYLAGILFGISGAIGGIPALRDTFSDSYAETWAAIIAAACLVCLIGEEFPQRLWRVEFFGVRALNGFVLVYAGAIFWAGIVTNDPGRGAVGYAILMMLALPGWRMFDIPRDRRVHGWR